MKKVIAILTSNGDSPMRDQETMDPSPPRTYDPRCHPAPQPSIHKNLHGIFDLTPVPKPTEPAPAPEAAPAP